MEAAVIRQFLDFFQDFINLCQSQEWLNNNTSPEEIRNAFLISQHIEKCVNKLQNKSLFDEFRSSLNKSSNTCSSALFKRCFSDPPKYMLKKILQSNIDVQQLDVSFSLFLEIYSEPRLEECLSDIMLETASQEALMKNMPVEFSKDKLLKFKSLILLSEISSCNQPEIIEDAFKSCEKDMIELLVECLLNNDFEYLNARKQIVNAFLKIMLGKSANNQRFWSIFLALPEESLTNLCLLHSDLFKTTCKALLDIGRLINEDMSSDFFYIKLTHNELLLVLQKLLKNDNLKMEFHKIIIENNSDLEFWNSALKSC